MFCCCRRDSNDSKNSCGIVCSLYWSCRVGGGLEVELCPSQRLSPGRNYIQINQSASSAQYWNCCHVPTPNLPPLSHRLNSALALPHHHHFNHFLMITIMSWWWTLVMKYAINRECQVWGEIGHRLWKVEVEILYPSQGDKGQISVTSYMVKTRDMMC